MIKLSGMWKHKKPQDGSVYFTGNLGQARLVMFHNTYKENENEPDYILYVDEKKKTTLNDTPEVDVTEGL